MEPTTIKYGRGQLQGRWELICRTRLSFVYLFTHDGFSLDEWLPGVISRWVAHPLVLPKQFVIKLYHSNEFGHEYDVFRTERDGYGRMVSIQGSFVPQCYGEVAVVGSDKPALALQYLDGANLVDLLLRNDPKQAGWNTEEVCNGIRSSFEEISKCNVMHCDVDPTKLNNLMYASALCPKPGLYTWILAMGAVTTFAALLRWLPLLVFCSCLVGTNS